MQTVSHGAGWVQTRLLAEAPPPSLMPFFIYSSCQGRGVASEGLGHAQRPLPNWIWKHEAGVVPLGLFAAVGLANWVSRTVVNALLAFVHNELEPQPSVRIGLCIIEGADTTDQTKIQSTPARPTGIMPHPVLADSRRVLWSAQFRGTVIYRERLDLSLRVPTCVVAFHQTTFAGDAH